jgi:hypothetical protein
MEPFRPECGSIGSAHPGCARLQGTPAAVVLRLLILNHIRNWSYQVLEREVRANLVYRNFSRVGGAKMPEAVRCPSRQPNGLGQPCQDRWCRPDCQNAAGKPSSAIDSRGHSASGFGRIWNFKTFGRLPLPPSICQPA